MPSLFLLNIWMHDVATLTRHRVVDGQEPRLTWHFLDDRLQAALSLLIVEAHLRGDGSGRISLLLAAEIQALKLLGGSGHIHELLLQLLLALSEVNIGGDELSILVWIHVGRVLLAYVKSGRSKDMLGTVHLLLGSVVAVLIMTKTGE